VINPAEEGRSYSLDAVRDNFEHWKGAWEELEVTVEYVIDAGEDRVPRLEVTLHGRVRGHSRRARGV
jgi:hypothetical protein